MKGQIRPIKPTDTVLDSVVPGVRRKVPAGSVADKPHGVWIVAGTSWIYEGPSYVIPYATELEALHAANETEYYRAWFVPFGTDLNEVMNARYTTVEPKKVGE